ncbi:MAG: DUF58 domain-containing protein [Verrucomicrobia bacterium]|nr:DUF58 domain-containing protein [Verrucomicrobiota bacterium]
MSAPAAATAFRPAAELQAAARGLALTARQLVEGAMAGLHPSRQPGLAREFSQYRAYQPGDEPRHIDWKLFARSDRYFVRESEIETAVALRLVLDATESMRQTDVAGGLTKFEAARQLAAAFAWIAQGQGDAVGLHAISSTHPLTLPASAHRRPFERVVHALAGLVPGGHWPARLPLITPARRELVVVLTDGHERSGEIRAALAPLQAREHELLFVHLLTREELEFPARGALRFEEWETGAALELDSSAVRTAYLAAHERHLRAWRQAWSSDRFHYAAVSIDEPLAPSLRRLLRRRARQLPGR